MIIYQIMMMEMYVSGEEFHETATHLCHGQTAASSVKGHLGRHERVLKHADRKAWYSVGQARTSTETHREKSIA
jgi:hypothetical protein